MMARLQLKGQNLYVGIAILSLCLVFILVHTKFRQGKPCVVIHETYHPLPLYLRAVDDRADPNVLVLQSTLMKQRNALSKQMNEMSKVSGQKDCEVTTHRATNGPPAIRHSMAYRLRAVGGPLLCASWVNHFHPVSI